jgi:hypothetical protein
MERGTSALLTIELDEQLQNSAKEIRVVQNKEPKHFLSIFKNKFMVHSGKFGEPTRSKWNLYEGSHPQYIHF